MAGSTTASAARELARLARVLLAGASYHGLDDSMARQIAGNINAMLNGEPGKIEGVMLSGWSGNPLWDAVSAVNDDGMADGMSGAWDDCMFRSGLLAAATMIHIYDAQMTDGPGDTFYDPEETPYWRKIFRIIVDGINWSLLLDADDLPPLRECEKERLASIGSLYSKYFSR